MNLLHNASSHLADSSMLEVFKTWHGFPEWLTPSLYEAFLRSAHCLLCELYRRQIDHPSGSGLPSQIPGYALTYDFIAFTIRTFCNFIGFYIFFCCATGAIRIEFVTDKSANSLIEAVRDVQDWLGRYGHTLVKLRTVTLVLQKNLLHLVKPLPIFQLITLHLQHRKHKRQTPQNNSFSPLLYNSKSS